MPTAEELVKYATSLTASAAALTNKANDPTLGFTDAQAAHNKAWAIGQQAWKVNNLAQDALVQDVAQAINSLTAANDSANKLITGLNEINAVLSVGAAILSVAAAVATGNVLGTAGAVSTLVTSLINITTVNTPSTAAGAG